jgi:uncharacterized protein YqgC (DUF456 family)
MNLTDTAASITVISGIAVVAGIIGVVVPVLPGLVLCWAGVLFWALFGHAGPIGWVVLVVATLATAAGTAIKYLWPGKRLKNTGVPTSSLMAGGVLGAVGFFVIPVLGLVLGFVLGVWLAERARLGPGRAWPSTRAALGAVGLSMLVELVAALIVAGVWLLGLTMT